MGSVFVIGASAGGLEALRALTAFLELDFDAPILAVIHFPQKEISHLPEILRRDCALPIDFAVDGEPIRGGRIYIAPPDRHLVVREGRIGLTRGPTENGMRPAIDPLFRTAGATYGARTVGILLSGCLDDGVQGLSRIRREGGIGWVQDPREAMFGGMSESAIEVGVADAVLTLRQMSREMYHRSWAAEGGDSPVATAREADISEIDEDLMRQRAIDGDLTGLTCPDCSGAIWRTSTDGIQRFECRVGHAYSLNTFESMQNATIENRFWSLLRSVEERIAFCTTQEKISADDNRQQAAHHWRRQLRQCKQQAKLIAEWTSADKVYRDNSTKIDEAGRLPSLVEPI